MQCSCCRQSVREYLAPDILQPHAKAVIFFIFCALLPPFAFLPHRLGTLLSQRKHGDR